MTSKCELCGEPMPPGEQVFKYHGYSGPCPAPPLSATRELDHAIDQATNREAFEKWVRAHYRNLPLRMLNGTMYVHGDVQRMWAAWQAARSAA